MIAAGATITTACRLASVERRQFYRWRKCIQGEKDTHPKSAKATQATVINVPIAAPVDQNENPGNVITGVAAQTMMINGTAAPVDQNANPGNIVAGEAAVLLPNVSNKLLHGNLRSLHNGRNSILAPIEEDLLQFILEYREQGIQVTTKMIRKFTKNLMPGYHLKSRNAKDQ